jgi:ATP-dependent Zn protease
MLMVVDVARARERDRRRRLRRIAIVLVPIATWLWIRLVTGNPVRPGLPTLPEEAMFWLPGILLVLVLGAVFILPMLGNGRSPHTIYLPEQIQIGFDDVKGIGGIVGEVRHTLGVFLNHTRFRIEMGGIPRRGVLFEGPPGTGKTHIAKAMAKEAGVPFLYVSSTAFQSMWYGATARKIRTFFRDLRKVARREGGAIGFIEEIDAIGMRRGGLTASTPANSGPGAMIARAGMHQGTGGVVNELLVQMQSFDEPTRTEKIYNGSARFANRFLPANRQIKTKKPAFANVLLIGATNRADALDPALLRPGRFDRILSFGLPSRADRRDLIDYFLTRRAHEPDLDTEGVRESIAATTIGYTPAALERLFDEALLVAMRNDRDQLSADDMRRAQMEVEIGLPQPVDYTDDERLRIASHEAGHATVAYLAGKGRRLEVLSIVKRRDSLGLLAHRDAEERWTRTESELQALLKIAMGGMVSEEMFFGESSTGPAGDLAAATQLAADMVGSFGLGGSLISFRSIDTGLVGGNLVAKVLADPHARKVVHQMLNDAKYDVVRLLTDHRYLVEALRNALAEREELVEHEITEVLREAEAAHLADDDVVVDLRNPDRPHIESGAVIEFQPLPEITPDSLTDR